jgi:hypothetical protein
MEKEIRIKKNLSWKELKALNDLFIKQKSSAKVQNYDYFKYLIDDVNVIDRKEGNNKILIPTESFNEFYEKHFKENFSHYNDFLKSHDLDSDARKNYNEFDIKTLMFISENKSQITPHLSTIRKFSSQFFEGKGSKYLEDKKSVKAGVHKILGIAHFPELEAKEHQWRFVVDCPNPRAVVLCENLDSLKLPWLAQKSNIKLWYVGGNNIGIIDQIDREEFKRPFFYSGDWDLAGLNIYSRIRSKLAKNDKEITLLFPNNPNNRLPVSLPEHKSKWIYNKELSGLNSTDFSSKQVQLIKNLILTDEWIEEESNNLILMLANSENGE